MDKAVDEISINKISGQVSDKHLLTEPEIRKLAHLPMLTVFYLSLQKQLSATPVTALELSAYLGVEVEITEGILSFLESRGIVRAFKKDMPAYLLTQDLSEINANDLMGLLGEFHEQFKLRGLDSEDSVQESNTKYRKIYSELASEILKLFGQESANQLPV
ncbi:MAG: hypothetical protein KDK66_00205 [Deltaproteobacteria bacterium]|nr:hypothetical protein [Deltaproteobacteria bacterium]